MVGLSLPVGDKELKLPYGDAVNKVMDVGGDTLKDAILGPSPTPGNNDIGLNPPNFDHQAYNVLASTEIPDNLRQDYKELFDSNGKLKPWEELETVPITDGRDSDPTRAVTTLFNRLGLQDGHDSSMRAGYDQVTGGYRTPGTQEPRK